MTTQSLAGMTAIITGGGTGIGRGAAEKLAALGMNVVICGRRKDRLDAVTNLLGEKCFPVVADVSQEADAARVVEAAIAQFGAETLHTMINNAAVDGGGRVHEHDVAEWDRIMAINVRGPFLMSRAALPILRQNKRGHIVNISSESGIEHYPGDGAYGVSKHALNAFSEYTQRENQDSNIRVDTICPGMVVTEMTEHSAGLDHSKCLTPEDIAELIAWLITRRENVKIGSPILIQTMLNPWE